MRGVPSFHPFVPEFLKCTFPSLHLGIFIIADWVLLKIKNRKANSVDPDEIAHNEQTNEHTVCKGTCFGMQAERGNNRNKVLTALLLTQGNRYHKLHIFLLIYYRRYTGFMNTYKISLKTLQLQGISETEFYGDLFYEFRKIVWKSFSYLEEFSTIIVRFKRKGPISKNIYFTFKRFK